MKSGKDEIFSIISIEKINYINSLIEKTSIKDVHCLPKYLKLLQDFGYGEGFFFYYGDDHEFILTPFFKRDINEDDQYFDIVSPSIMVVQLIILKIREN